MNTLKLAKAFRSFAEGFALLADALEDGAQEPVANEVPEVFEESDAWQEEEPPAKEKTKAIELEDLQEAGRQVIKLLGAPALAKVLKAKGLKNLSSADPKDYPTLYAEIKELTNG